MLVSELLPAGFPEGQTDAVLFPRRWLQAPAIGGRRQFFMEGPNSVSAQWTEPSSGSKIRI